MYIGQSVIQCQDGAHFRPLTSIYKYNSISNLRKKVDDHDQQAQQKEKQNAVRIPLTARLEAIGIYVLYFCTRKKGKKWKGKNCRSIHHLR
jgi:hypothetical protein